MGPSAARASRELLILSVLWFCLGLNETMTTLPSSPIHASQGEVEEGNTKRILRMVCKYSLLAAADDDDDYCYGGGSGNGGGDNDVNIDDEYDVALHPLSLLVT